MDNDEPRDEFSTAIEIERFHRCAVNEDEVFFGILTTGGEHVRFKAATIVAANLSEEIGELVRASRYVRAHGSADGFFPLNSREPLQLGVDGKLTPYTGVIMKLVRAQGHIEALAILLEDMGRRARLTPTRLPDQDGREVYRLDLSPKPPVSIPLIIGDAVHNLRSALDVLVNDIARIQGSDGDRLAFPFAEKEDNLAKLLRKIEPISAPLAQAIKALRPFSGGNEDLVGLHRLDNIDKHRMVLPAFVSQFKRWDLAGQINQLRATEGQPPLRISVISDGMDQTPFRDGQTIYCQPGKGPFDGYDDETSTFEVQFPDSGPFRSERVLGVLDRLYTLVEDICIDLSGKFPPPTAGEGGAARR